MTIAFFRFNSAKQKVTKKIDLDNTNISLMQGLINAILNHSHFSH
jgi:hypothetical protein